MKSLSIPFIVFCIILFLWSVYRYLFHLPVWADELIAKPLIHILPILLVVFRVERGSWESLGFPHGKLLRYISIGVLIGIGLAVFRLITLYIYGKMPVFVPMGKDGEGVVLGLLSNAATGVSEEVLFRGYLFTRLERITKNMWLSLVISSIFFVLIHIPIMIWGFGYDVGQGTRWGVFLFNQGLLLGLIFAYTRSLPVVIGVHAVWNAAVRFFP